MVEANKLELDSFSLRLAKTDEYVLVKEMYQEATQQMNAEGNFQWDQTYPQVSDIHLNIQAKTLQLICNTRSEIAGCCTVDCIEGKEYLAHKWGISGKACVIHRLAIRAKYQGKGLSQLIFDLAEKIAKDNFCVAIRSDTGSKNIVMQHLFVKNNLKRVGTLFYDGYPETYYTYEKLL